MGVSKLGVGTIDADACTCRTHPLEPSSLCTTRFNVNKLYVLPTECIYVLLGPARYSCVAPLNTALHMLQLLFCLSAEKLHLVGHSCCIELAVNLFSLTTCPIITSCTINVKRTGLGLNTGLDVEMPATNRLSHGTALKYCWL